MKTILLVGAGSVLNSWEPIHSALSNLYPSDIIKEQRVEIGNLIMARQVYLARFQIQYHYDDSAEKSLNAIKELNRIKERIRDEIQLALEKNTITVQPEFRQVADMACNDTDQLKLISTNWENVFENALTKYLQERKGILMKSEDVLHIHGEISFPETMYLPGEQIREPYRNSGHENELGKQHAAFLQYMEQADRLIIYGLSLNALDAELLQMVGAGISESNLSNIIIVDPNHEFISTRIKTIYGSTRRIRIDEVWKK